MFKQYVSERIDKALDIDPEAEVPLFIADQDGVSPS
jgi:hypothetical protein